MKHCLITNILLFFGFIAFAQSADSTSNSLIMPKLSLSTHNGGPSAGWKIISKENIAYKTRSLVLTATENQITDLESRECEALKNRDNFVLMGIWEKDFSLEEVQTEVVQNGNALPYYASLTRMIENLTQIDSVTVFTSGEETFQRISGTGKIEEPKKQRFFHVWKFESGVWKLSSKRSG